MLDREAIRVALARHPAHTVEPGELRPAAVLVPLFVKGGEDHLLFTRRTHQVNHHRGEISFPGGSWDPGDADLQATALRETEEEMGICPDDVQVLGRLHDSISVHGYHVVPYVGAFEYPYPFRVNAAEIDEVIEVPLETLRDPAIFRTEDWSHRGRIRPVPFYRVGRHEIWGLTAEILGHFLARIDPG